MTTDEEKEYEILLDKRGKNTMSGKEYKRYKILVNKAFLKAIPQIANSWIEGFKKS